MKFDKDKLASLTNMPDDQLWQTIVQISKANGITLPTKTPPHEELEKLRSLTRDSSRLNMTSAMKILSKYRGN